MAKSKSTKIKQGRNRVSLTRAIRKPTKPKKGRRLSADLSRWREQEIDRLRRPQQRVKWQ